MNHFRRISVVLLPLFLVSIPVVFVACGGGKSQSESSGKDRPDATAGDPRSDSHGEFTQSNAIGTDNSGGPVTDFAEESSLGTPQAENGVLAVLPDFELTDQDNRPFGARQLYKKVWIGNFIFTRCAATCPAQTEKMAELQRQLRRHPDWDNIRFVSFSVDPEFDTPDVLLRYARNAGADHNHWRFLTGTRDTIWELCKNGFKLAVGEGDDTTMPIFHSPMFVLVDPYLRIRGFYDVLSGDGLRRLRSGLDRVLRERAPRPPQIVDPPWLKQRKRDQLRTMDQFSVRHDFSFTDRIEESGIRFRNRVVDDATRNYKPVHYDHGNGVAIADVDGDGLSDIYFVTQVGQNELWRNLGNGRFEDVTQRAGVAVADRIGVTASFGDIDNDGDADLYVTTVRGGNYLFENDGTGKFQDISSQSGLDHIGHSSGAVFFDFDRDGLLDVFLTNVGKYTTDELAIGRTETVRRGRDIEYKYYVGFLDAFGGHLKPEERNEQSILFRNMGNNRFQDVSSQMRLTDVSWTGDATPLDFNQDGWVDLYVLNMQGHDEYYENVEGTHFRQRSREKFPNTPWGSMGVKSFDYDNDGDMDLFITDMHSDMSENVDPAREKSKSRMRWPDSYTLADGYDIWGNAFFQNQGDGTFREISDQIGAENYWPWGMSVGDLNADGFDDVFIASSMNYPFRYGVNTLLLNNRGERFLDSEFILGIEPRRNGLMIPWFELELEGRDRNHPLAEEFAEPFQRLLAEEGPSRVTVWSAVGSRSSVIFDLDNDGDLDIVTNEFNSKPMVLINNLAEKDRAFHYIKVKLRGTKSNRDGLGAVVTVHAGSDSYVKVYDGQSGYLSHSLYPLYFGLDEAETVDNIEVVWPSGTKQTVSDSIEVNSTIEIQEP